VISVDDNTNSSDERCAVLCFVVTKGFRFATTNYSGTLQPTGSLVDYRHDFLHPIQRMRVSVFRLCDARSSRTRVSQSRHVLSVPVSGTSTSTEALVRTNLSTRYWNSILNIYRTVAT
jgi:predicted ATPase with chaperone activity